MAQGSADFFVKRNRKLLVHFTPQKRSGGKKKNYARGNGKKKKKSSMQ